MANAMMFPHIPPPEVDEYDVLLSFPSQDESIFSVSRNEKEETFFAGYGANIPPPADECFHTTGDVFIAIDGVSTYGEPYDIVRERLLESKKKGYSCYRMRTSDANGQVVPPELRIQRQKLHLSEDIDFHESNLEHYQEETRKLNENDTWLTQQISIDKAKLAKLKSIVKIQEARLQNRLAEKTRVHTCQALLEERKVHEAEALERKEQTLNKLEGKNVTKPQNANRRRLQQEVQQNLERKIEESLKNIFQVLTENKKKRKPPAAIVKLHSSDDEHDEVQVIEGVQGCKRHCPGSPVMPSIAATPELLLSTEDGNDQNLISSETNNISPNSNRDVIDCDLIHED